jgi:phosphoribosyl-ATP pyrophosphohydrolase/phosphoribosyl-AMP cyclohydrolase
MEFEKIEFDEKGLVPAVVQDSATGEVLTLAYMNAESLAKTLQTGETWFWSRSRQELWHKGATSGNTQHVVSLALDCDQDAIVVRVLPRGPACHEGTRSCFRGPAGGALVRLDDVLEQRARDKPEGSYTVALLKDENKRVKKLGEELAELLRALYVGSDDNVANECADLLYHAAVALRARGIPLSKVAEILLERG